MNAFANRLNSAFKLRISQLYVEAMQKYHRDFPFLWLHPCCYNSPLLHHKIKTLSVTNTNTHAHIMRLLFIYGKILANI